MKWAKQIPNKAGYWLRVNAGHRVQLHLIGNFSAKKELEIYWGWGGEEQICRIKDIENKLDCFWWYGPLPRPPKCAL